MKRILSAGLLLVAAQTGWAQETVRYVHTDALGSPVAYSNAAGVVTERIVYEPYGNALGAVSVDGPGFTGHVRDGATLLSYMQQRYMDPQLGMFLSMDPVTAYEQPVGQFNRYRYANGNPYKFTDPDGRQALTMPIPYSIPVPLNNRGGNIQQNEDSSRGDRGSGSSGRPTTRPTERPAGRDTVRRGRDGQPIAEATPGEKVASAIDNIKTGKSAAPGIAGQRGELIGA